MAQPISFWRSSRRAWWLVGLAAAVAVGGGGVWLMGAPATFDDMKRKVRQHFPGVPQLSTEELAAWLKNPHREKPILLDTRTPEEFAVSHLKGAIRVDPSAKAQAILPLIPAGRSIVTYCSVGYRSSAVAERLQKAGVHAVSNLEGSIFQWANEGRPLEADGHPVEKVHPYDATFGKLLDPQKRATP